MALRPPRLFDLPGRPGTPPDAGRGTDIVATLVAAVHSCAVDHAEFTVDDVWVYLPDSVLDSDWDRRLIGNVVRAAVDRGWITKAPRTLTSTGSGRHSRTVSLWRSNIFDGTASDTYRRVDHGAEVALVWEATSVLPVPVVAEVAADMAAVVSKTVPRGGGWIAAAERLGWMQSCRDASLSEPEMRQAGWTGARVVAGRRDGRLVAVRDRSRWLLPRWQFIEQHTVVHPTITEVVAVWPYSMVALHVWLTARSQQLQGRAPVDLLDQPSVIVEAASGVSRSR